MPVPMSPTSAFLHKYVKSPVPTPMEVEPYSISKSDEDEPMDTSEQTDGVSLPPPRKICPATKPFESPRQKPIDGVVQPRTEPPPGKPTRHTNCLDFVLNTVLKDAMEHKCSWPFQSPVDAKKLSIPDYYKVIKKPMDLRTIEKRIRNIYYWNAADAILDIKHMFANCYAFNAPQNNVYRMAQILEKRMMSQIDGIPRIEKIELLPEHQRRTMFSVTDPYGKTETPKQRGRENTRGRKQGSDLDSHFDDEEGNSAAILQPPPPILRQNPNSMIDWKSLPPRWQGKEAEWQKFCSNLLKEIHNKENKGFAHVFYLPVDPIKLNIPDYLDIIRNPMDLQTMKKKLAHKQYADPKEFAFDMNLMITNCCVYNPEGSVVHQNALDLKALFDERWKSMPGFGLDPIASNSRREAKSDGNIAPALANNQLNQLEKQGVRIKSSPTKTSNSISPAFPVRSSAKAPVPNVTEHVGPSPTKTRKQSKPRVPVASVASSVPYPPKGDSRESESKSGQSRKKLRTPGSDSPHYVIPKKSRLFNNDFYVSIYGRKNVGVNEKKELSLKMATLQQDFVNPVLRIIQIGQFKAGQPVSSLRALCDEEIDFNKATDETILELLDYLQMVEVDKPRAGTVKTEMEVKAKRYGLHLFDDAFGMIAHHCIKPADDRARSNSPAPSAYRSENRSRVSHFDAHLRRNNNIAPPRHHAETETNGKSSSASNPAVTKPAPLNTRNVSEQPKGQHVLKSRLPPSVKEASAPITKPIEPAKNQLTKIAKPLEKKPAKPQTKRLTILDDLLPNTPEKNPVAAPKKPVAVTTSSSNSNSWMRNNTYQHDKKSSSLSSSSNNLMRKNTHQNDKKTFKELKATYLFPSQVTWVADSVTWLSSAPTDNYRVYELTEQEKAEELRDNERARQLQHEAKLRKARNRSPSVEHPKDLMDLFERRSRAIPIRRC